MRSWLTLMLTCSALASAAECSLKNAKSCVAACDAKEAAACVTLGHARLAGKGGLKVDGAGAVAAWDTACTLQRAEGCTLAADAMFGKVGQGTKADAVRANEWLRKACELRVGAACFRAGQELLRGGLIAKDAPAGLALVEKGCDANDANACTQLAALYREGSSVLDKDLVKAASLLQRACDLKSPQGCLELGVSYDQGFGVFPDTAQAHQRYLLACTLGAGLGCNNAGIDLRDGLGVKADAKAMVTQLERGCALKAGLACHTLATEYYLGTVLPKDLKKAFALFVKGCEATTPAYEACTNAGLMSREGSGTRRDAAAALKRLTRACEHHHELACDALDESKP